MGQPLPLADRIGAQTQAPPPDQILEEYWEEECQKLGRSDLMRAAELIPAVLQIFGEAASSDVRG